MALDTFSESDYVSHGDVWVNNSSSPITDPDTGQVISAGAKCTWNETTQLWDMVDSSQLADTPSVLNSKVTWDQVKGNGGNLPQDGATRNVNRGVYSNAVNYAVGDTVTDGANSWTCTVATTGNPPPASASTVSNTWWFLLAATGATGAKGTNGIDGMQYATIRLFQASASSTAPAVPTGTAAYTWSNGVISLTNTSLNSWTQNPSVPSAGQYQWVVELPFADVSTNATTTVNWSNCRTYCVGSSIQGTAGAAGKTAVRIYQTNTSTSAWTGSPTLPSGNSPAGWSTTGASSVSAGSYQWQCDGLYDPVTSTTVWGTPYLSLFKVGTLDALTVNTGSLTSYSGTGERLTINEVVNGTPTHEFRCYGTSNGLVASMGDASASSWESIFYNDIRNVTGLSTAGKTLIGFETRMQPYSTALADGAFQIGFMSGTRFANNTGLDGGVYAQLSQVGRSSGSGAGLPNLTYAGFFSSSAGGVVKTVSLSYQDSTGSAAGAFTYGNSQKTVLCDGTYAINTVGDVNVSGAIIASGNVSAYSDKRLKTNLKPIDDPVNKIRGLTGYSFDWNDQYKAIYPHVKSGIGWLAQDVKKVIPEAVTKSPSGYLVVDTTKVIPVLTEVIKQLLDRVEALENDASK